MVGGSCELREFRPDKASYGPMMGGLWGAGGLGSPENGGVGLGWFREAFVCFSFDTKLNQTEPN